PTPGDQGLPTGNQNPLESGFTKGTNLCENVSAGLPQEESGLKVVFRDDFLGDTEGYGSLNCNGITFTRVAYVNDLKNNLISISQLCDANYKVLFSKTQFPPTDRSDFTHEEFIDELAHIISPPDYDCFYFRNLPDLSEWISILNSRICENLSFTTRVNLPVKDDHSPLFSYVVWIFLAYLTYPVIPPYLHSFGNKNTIFDPSITINRFYSFKPGLSHRCGTFKKFNTHHSHLNESLMEMLFSTCFPMDQ
nr:retrovirus-related Pol polyprotein from transposon TNT 1-94 [Tanacetum cinerariifolium]